MNNLGIVGPALDKARIDIENATDALATVWTADDHDAIGRLANTAEALTRALSSLAFAVERLAELPVNA